MKLSFRRSFFAAAAVATLAFAAGCSSADSTDDTVDPLAGQGDGAGVMGEALTVSIPQIGFNEMPADKKEVALTFDDGPAVNGSTESILDTLKANNIQATFFLNTDNTVPVDSSSVAKNNIQRMVDEGHFIGNHSVHHYNLSLTKYDPQSEFDGVDETFHNIVPDAPAMTLIRAPYGNPFFGPQSAMDRVGPVIATHGVHIGWHIDTDDWNCVKGGPQCVIDNLTKQLNSGMRGIILMHCIYEVSAQALPEVITTLKNGGYHFVTVEDMVQAKYGVTSDKVVPRAYGADGKVVNMGGGITTPVNGGTTTTGAGPATPAACTVKTTGATGTCITTTACAAMTGYSSTAGYCPGAANVECCTEDAQ